jgi:hypothetical protein
VIGALILGIAPASWVYLATSNNVQVSAAIRCREIASLERFEEAALML